MADPSTEAREAKGRGLVSFLPRVLEIVLVIVAILCIVVFVTQDFKTVMRMIFSPVMFLIVVIVFVEYLIVKSGDRSRLYRIEIDRLHEREHETLGRTRRALEETLKALEHCREIPIGGDSAACETAVNGIKESLRQIEKILRPDLKE